MSKNNLPPIIPAGFVRIERKSFRYPSNGGPVTVAHEDIQDIEENKAIDWISGEIVYVTWPDGHIESWDLRHTPSRLSPHAGFGYITRNGEKEQVTLSRLPNVAKDYYRAIEITPKERATFVAHVFE